MATKILNDRPMSPSRLDVRGGRRHLTAVVALNLGGCASVTPSCWSPPSDNARAGMQVAVRFSFNKAGGLIGPPRLTFATAGVPADTRTTYLNAINSSLNACLPLKFTSGLGGALAGRPIAIRYVDNRELGK